ncbi:MAG: hypothetical protein CV080_09025 [Candidatus Kuenenia stuttgartiensis]|nr:MAG: hypothetical protein CV080_09025 [Candidatus Kuenenia stuttgartiensis]
MCVFENDLHEKRYHAHKELFAERKKLKIIQINQNKPFLSELSKKQKVIFDAFGIREEVLHSY